MVSTSLILASASPRRKALLAQMGITPDQILAPDIDETPHSKEAPHAYVMRMAQEKAAAIFAAHPQATVLAADTVVARGQRIFPKATSRKEAQTCLRALSGRKHQVMTAVCVMQGGNMRTKLVTTTVKFAPLSAAQIDDYVNSGEWEGKAGGYGIQGSAECFVQWLRGSYSAVVGLPLYETQLLLRQ